MKLSINGVDICAIASHDSLQLSDPVFWWFKAGITQKQTTFHPKKDFVLTAMK